MKRFTPALTLLLFLIAAAMTSCTSVETLVENGNYEETIRRASRKLSGKEKKNPKFVLALERAVNNSITRDMADAKRMAESGTPEWGRIHQIYEDVDRRQRALQPLLPLVDKKGRRAKFEFVNIAGYLAEASDNAADQYYTQGLESLSDGRLGNKEAARIAYRNFNRVTNYRSGYRNTRELLQEARELGKVFIYVTMQNESGAYLPRGFEDELLQVKSRNMDSKWRFFDFQERPEVDYDYDAQIVIRDIQVSPERITERIYTDEREITDGTEYVLDANGNVAKDTLGNDITRPRRIIVRAEVTEILQTKTALVTGSLVLYDNDLNRIVEEDGISAEANFNYYVNTFRGDRRALSRASNRWIGNRPTQFPSDEDLILDAADVLKPRLQEMLASSYNTL